MSCQTILDQLVKDGTVDQVLRRDTIPKDQVKAFKQILFELGFDEVVNPQDQQIDGIYGDSTVATVKSFCEKNSLESDGERVTEAIAKVILQRYSSLPDMLQLHQDLITGKISEKYYKGSPDQQAISSLQKLLHDLGFKNELDWENNKNNGTYGEATANAVKAFMEKKIDKATPVVPVVEKAEQIFDGCGNILSHLMKKGGLSSVLKKGAIPHIAINELQKNLHKLGFGNELGKSIDKLDNVFGPSVVNAVKSFATKNGIESDGTKITQSIAGVLQDKLKDLPFLHQLQRDFREGKVSEKYFKGSKDKMAISALQHVLNKLGKGKELNWDQKGNNGIFDNSVAKALKSYFKKGPFANVSKVTPQMMFSVLQDAGKTLGPDWQDHVQELKGDDNSVLTRFTASNFQGIHVVANVGFVSSLEKINAYAVKNNVQVYVTNAYRRDTHVPGAIVPPASMSNHKVGHAIDMNLKYDGGKNANSVYMHPSNRDNWVAPVRGFLDDIINDPSLKWGGEFHTNVDPVHIDDRLNHNDPEEWHKQRDLTVKAFDENNIREWKA